MLTPSAASHQKRVCNEAAAVGAAVGRDCMQAVFSCCCWCAGCAGVGADADALPRWELLTRCVCLDAVGSAAGASVRSKK